MPTDSVFACSRTRPAAAEEVRDRVDAAGVRVGCVSNSRDAQLLLGPHGPHTDGVWRGSPDEKVEHARRAAREAIALAGAIGAPHVRLLLGCPDYARWLRWTGSDVGWDDNIDAFVQAATPLAREAAEQGVLLCIEPHVKQVAFDAGSLLACVDGVRRAGEDLGVCFDPANVAALGYDPVELLRSTGLVPVAVHVKDVERSSSSLVPDGAGWVRYGPQPAIRFRSAPWGELEWPRLLTHLRETGFGGQLLIEHEDVVIDREQGIAGTRRLLESLRMGDRPGPAWW